MKKINREERLKKLLQQVGPDKPGADFTAVVMKEITAAAQDSAVTNPALQSLLKQHGVEIPAGDLTHIVMARVKAQGHKPIPQAIISKKAWYVIALVAVVFIVLPGLFT